MKDGADDVATPSTTTAAAALNSGARGTAVGPLRVSTSKLAPAHLVASGADDDPRPGEIAEDEGERARDDEGGGRSDEGHGDADAPELGSFSTMGAVIGDFSPQFKFSFTDDIHLDLGGGLKVRISDK